jgi:uncharacterized surface protein with fasciclin (FAS1) repeats
MGTGTRPSVNADLDELEKHPTPMKSHITTILATALAVATLAPQTVRAVDPTAPAMTQPDIVAAANSKAELATLVTAIKAAELVTALQEQGPFTVFAPTDKAFAKLPAGALEDLLKPENRAKLAGILKGHVISGRITAADVKTGEVKSLSGKSVQVSKKDGKVYFGNALVVSTDFSASNGVIHEIDTVVIPE